MSKKQTPKIKKPKTKWHDWFSGLFKVLLVPIGLVVKASHPVMNELPEADILIHKENKKLTKAQWDKLPDGIRESKASHIIIELKYTESLNEDAYCQILGYYKFYKESNKLKNRMLMFS